MVTYIFYCSIIVYISSSLLKKKFIKLIVREKFIGESVQESVLWNANYDRENNDYASFTSTSFQMM